MERWVDGEWPFVAVWLFFCSGALMRGSFLHWLGRRVRRFDQSHGALAERPVVLRAQAVVGRYGAPAVTLAHLTVGVQSAVMVASGLLLMPLRRFVPALLLGAAIWATVYTTVGMSVLYAAVGRAHWGWFLGVAAALVVLVLVLRRTTVVTSLRAAGAQDEPGGPGGQGGPADQDDRGGGSEGAGRVTR